MRVLPQTGPRQSQRCKVGEQQETLSWLRGTPLFAGGYREIEESICETQCRRLLYTTPIEKPWLGPKTSWNQVKH